MKPRIFSSHTLSALNVFSLLSIHQTRAADITWDPGVSDIHWSTADNWSDNADPAGDDLTFNNTGRAAGTTVTSIVDAAFTIDSLQFTHDNTANHTLSISDTLTLGVTGSFTPTNGQATAVLLSKPDGGNTATTYLTGLGTFTVNNASNHFLVGFQNGTNSSRVTLDMSELETFDATVNILGVGRKGTINTDTTRQESGYLVLAKNSNVTANAITVGDSTGINGTAATGINNGAGSTLFLSSGGDRVNNLNANTMIFGRGKSSGNMQFDTGALSTDTVTLRGTAGGSTAVTDFIIADRNLSSTSGTPGGTVNFGAGEVDALITNLIVGRWGSAAGTSQVNPSGTFTMGTNSASDVTVTTLSLGISATNTNPGTARIVTGTLNVNSGTFSANTVNLATGNTTASLTKTANLNVDGGTFRFGTFGAPTGTNAVSINFQSGTVASTDATNRTLGLAYNLGKTGGSTVTFGQASGGTGTLALNGAGTLIDNTTVEIVQDTTLGGALGGAFSLTKTGAATLIINQNQTWSDGTTISAGTLKMSGNKTLASGSNVTVGASGTWQLDGTSQTLGELTGSGVVTSTWVTSGFDTLTLGSGDASSSFSGTISGGNGTSVRGIALTKTGDGTVALSGDNSYSGVTTVNTGVLGISHANALGATGADARTQINGNLNTGRVELSGGITTGETFRIAMRQNAALDAPALSNLSGDNTVTGDIEGLTGGSRINIESQAGLLTLAGNLSQTDGTNSRTWQLMGAGNGLVSGVISNGTADNLGIIKSGAGTWTFSNTNSYTGNTSVNQGTLALGETGSIATSSVVTLAAGATLDTSARASFTMSGTQAFAFGLDGSGSGSSGQILADGLDISAALVTFNVTGTLDDPAYVLATYTNSSLAGTEFDSVTPPTGYELDYAHNGGTQIALVQLPATGYTNWLALHPGMSDTSLGGDEENDGIENLLEYILDGDPLASDSDILPDLDASGSNFIFTFTRREESANDTTQVFQYGSDLSGWTDLNITAPTAAEVALGTPSGGLQSVTVTIPKGSNTSLFGRLKCSQP